VAGDLLTDGVEVLYGGSATIAACGRACLHDRVGGIGEMVWEALADAGWIGELATIRMTVALRVGVAPAPATTPRRRARFEARPGRVRQLGEKGRVDGDGFVWQQSIGPLNPRAAGHGYRLLASEGDPEDLEFGEDMLYTAAVQAGWLTGTADEIVDISDVRILVGVARRNPRWETFARGAADPGEAPPAPAPVVGGIDESALLPLARKVAAQSGDPNPELIQHARGSRFELTQTTGSVVFSDAPSYIVVMKGNFHTRRTNRRARPTDAPLASYSFRTIVIEIETGKITDSGCSDHAPDLTALDAVITDHPHD
jgi:hypothetical protein